MRKKNILTYLFLVMLTLLTSCSYDEKINTYDVAVAVLPVALVMTTGTSATASLSCTSTS